jgi:hypothetical protein
MEKDPKFEEKACRTLAKIIFGSRHSCFDSETTATTFQWSSGHKEHGLTDFKKLTKEVLPKPAFYHLAFLSFAQVAR